MSTIYDEMGIEYDTTRKANPLILNGFERLLNIEYSKKYVDVACVTGNYTVALASISGEWFAFDNSPKNAQ